MRTSRLSAGRIVLAVAVAIGILFAEAELLTPPDAAFKTVYAAQGLTPNPTPTATEDNSVNHGDNNGSNLASYQR